MSNIHQQSTFCQNWYPWCDPFLRQKKKIVFWIFSKLVWSCLEVVCALFLAFKYQSSWEGFGRKGDIWPLKSKVLSPMLVLWEDQSDYLSGKKPSSVVLLQVGLECNRSCSPLGFFFFFFFFGNKPIFGYMLAVIITITFWFLYPIIS